MKNITGKSILLVEDEAILAMSFQDMLEELGTQVIGPAVDVEQALGLLGESETIDLALLDVDLSGATSMPIARQLEARRIPYMFATGFGSRILPEAPNAPVLAKPFTPKQLADSLTRLLNEAVA